jgi:hypothetical protein
MIWIFCQALLHNTAARFRLIDYLGRRTQVTYMSNRDGRCRRGALGSCWPPERSADNADYRRVVRPTLIGAGANMGCQPPNRRDVDVPVLCTKPTKLISSIIRRRIGPV